MNATSDTLTELSGDERVAVWMLRYLAGPGRPCCRLGTGGWGDMFFRQDLEALGSAFRHALDRCSGFGMNPLDVRMRECGSVSLTEMNLLDATALAQKGDERGMKAVLRKVFPQHHVVTSFATAMVQLGACLASAGFWLLSRVCVRDDVTSDGQAQPGKARVVQKAQPVAEAARPVAAASLVTLSRWRNNDMAVGQVLWPVMERQSGLPAGA
ncbi:MAG: hypothetical protein ABF968_02510 [Acetobacter sp.]|uniref:hypothetical protein n=1 Tax=Acetobacter sp. TaxID=440 RepID=UPI0039EAAFDE